MNDSNFGVRTNMTSDRWNPFLVIETARVILYCVKLPHKQCTHNTLQSTISANIRIKKSPISPESHLLYRCFVFNCDAPSTICVTLVFSLSHILKFSTSRFFGKVYTNFFDKFQIMLIKFQVAKFKAPPRPSTLGIWLSSILICIS